MPTATTATATATATMTMNAIEDFVITVEDDKGSHVARLTANPNGSWSYNGVALLADNEDDQNFAMALIGRDIASRAIDFNANEYENPDDDDVALVVTLQCADRSDATLLTSVLQTPIDPTPEDVTACVQAFMRFVRIAATQGQSQSQPQSPTSWAV